MTATSRLSMQTERNQDIPSMGYFLDMILRFLFIPTLFATLVFTSLGFAQGDPGMEEKFIAMVKDSTLKGTWAPVMGEQLGGEKKDEGYRIARAEKKDKDGDKWAIVTIFEFNGQKIEFP